MAVVTELTIERFWANVHGENARANAESNGRQNAVLFKECLLADWPRDTHARNGPVTSGVGTRDTH